MCEFFGRVSENASEFPEVEAVARSQSFFVAFSFSVAMKMPLAFAAMRATERHAPLVPCRSWTVTTCLSLVASRPQTLTLFFCR